MRNYTGRRDLLLQFDQDYSLWVYYKDEERYRHRLDGPALESTGSGFKEYWIDDKPINEEDYYKHPDVIKYAQLQKLKLALGV